MSDYGSPPNERGDGEDSPDEARSLKRRRIALACLDCRRRKLKCDRIFPACTRCRKGRKAASCIYDPDAVETIIGPASAEKGQTNGNRVNGRCEAGSSSNEKAPGSPSSFIHHHALDRDDSAVTALRAHIYRLETRLISLEKTIIDPFQPQYPRPRTEYVFPGSEHAPKSADAQDAEVMMFRGKSFKTQFYGASHHTSHVTHLPKLRTFMNDMVIQHPGLASVQKELKGTKVKSEERVIIHKGGHALAQLLPPKDLADQLVETYINSFETTYRVLHLPTFFNSYNDCWRDPKRAQPDIVALLLAIMAATVCINPRNPSAFRGDSSLERESAIRWIEAAESWLNLQSHKHVKSTTFQIQCIVFIAQSVNAVKRKRTWTSIGTLARNAMSAGLHRDAEMLNLSHGNITRKVSLFDQEIRRRVWTTIAELELQVSLDRGMPAMLRDVITDCGPPLNVDDEDILPATEYAPKSLPKSSFTRSSFLYLAHSTYELRQDLVSLINGSRSQLAYEDILHYDRKIMQALDDIPMWIGARVNVNLPRTLLHLQLHQLRLLLHRPYVVANSRESRYEYSSVVHLKAALRIIDLHQTLVSRGCLVMCLMRNDILGSVLNICFNITVSSPRNDQSLSTSETVLAWSDPVRYLEHGLSMSDIKISRVGVGIQEYYCICSVIGLCKKEAACAPLITTHEFQAADRVSKMIQKLLSMQDNYSAATTLASLPNLPPTTVNGISSVNTVTPNGQTDMTKPLEAFNQDLQQFDFTDVSGWDIDAFFNF